MQSLCSHRGGRDYEFRDEDLGFSSGNWMFCWNVKLYQVDLSFDNLVRSFVQNHGCGELDPEFKEAARIKHGEIRESTLLEWGVEDAARSFVGREGGYPDDDAYSMLWDGSPVVTRFSLMGRSAGWLVMTRFQDRLLTTDLDFDAISYKEIRGLSEMVHFVHRSVNGRACSAVEDCAAFNFFVNSCSDLKGAPG
jgi:hypothetical protein